MRQNDKENRDAPFDADEIRSGFNGFDTLRMRARLARDGSKGSAGKFSNTFFPPRRRRGGLKFHPSLLSWWLPRAQTPTFLGTIYSQLVQPRPSIL